MIRLSEALGEGGALVVYLTASNPSHGAFLQAARGAAEGGARVLEIGVPYTDPVADGPVIQAAHARALSAGGGTMKTLELVRELKGSCDVPVTLFTYVNPVLSLGAERFVKLARESGVDGVLTLDVPPEEEPSWYEMLSGGGLDPVVLISPNTTLERAGRILKKAGGFVYLVSREGVTGTHAGASAGLAVRVGEIRALTDLPIAVGFGVKDRAGVAEILGVCEAAVVGSALAREIGAAGPEAAFELAKGFVRSLMAEHPGGCPAEGG